MILLTMYDNTYNNAFQTRINLLFFSVSTKLGD